MVGCPGSGKSHFVLKQLEKANHMRRINRDLLGNWQNCVREARAVLKNNKGVVIDNTNPDKESRKRFIELAKEFNVPCRVFMMNTSKEHAKHNNKVRLYIFFFFSKPNLISVAHLKGKFGDMTV